MNLLNSAKLAVLGTVGLSAIGFLGMPGSANAASIGRGSDYLQTPTGFSFFNFPGIGAVNLQGLPVGPGNTDTIIQRKADCILPGVGSSCTIPIELTLLSMESVNPVNIGGSFFDVDVSLTPATQSTGTMTINHDFPDNNTPAPEGTFTSDFTVFFDALFTPIGGGAGFTISDSIRLINNGAEWSHEPPPGTLLVTAPVGNQLANCHANGGPLCAVGELRDFFPAMASHGKPGGNHTTVITACPPGKRCVIPVPEPSTAAATIFVGLGAMFGLRRNRKSQKD